MRGHCSENVCAMLVKIAAMRALWISLCITGYKAGGCWGLQQSVKLSQFSPCQPLRTPYNAPPLTRNNGLQAGVLRSSGSSEPPEKTSEKEVDSEGGKRNIRHLATVRFSDLLHRSLTIYQTICVGTRRIDISAARRKKYQAS
ncbi:hypothetical protein FQ626_04310 [Erwinia pyrifoliae]|nr:hypothetical protein [Erwinia pyrifoliae]